MNLDNQVGNAFLTETANRVDKSFCRINHCIDQLDVQDIWWRPNEKMNSIGNLILHICGALGQWILNGLGEQEDIRDRPSEFESRKEISKKDLKLQLSNLKVQIDKTLKDFNPAVLMQERRIQGFDVQLLNAVYSAMTHLEGHTGQIMYITRIRKGNDYKIFWYPETEEQESKGNRRSKTKT